MSSTPGEATVTTAPITGGNTDGGAYAAHNATGDIKRLQFVTGHGLYTLPEDHMWHAGGIYDTGKLEEWHYWTGFFTDDDTGEQFGLFYSVFHDADASGRMLYRVYFSLGDLAAKQLTWAVQPTAGPLEVTAPPGSTSPHDFQYQVQLQNVEFTTIYRVEPDTWSLHYAGVASNGGQPVGLDLELQPQTPYGYLPLGIIGWENENAPWSGQPDPTTMNSVSYYYGSPKTTTKGTVTVGDRVRHVTGSLWFEHQWGNFAARQMPWAIAYVWSAIQFDDGSIFTFRQWYDQQAQPIPSIGRSSYSTPEGTTTYAMGNSTVWKGLKTWRSPTSGRNIPVQSSVTSPHGTWYLTAVFDDYEMPFGFPPYGDLDGYYSVLTEDVVYTGSTVRHGREEARAFDQRVWDAVPNHWRTVEKLLVSGDVVAVWIKFGGTTEPAKRRFEIEFCDIIEVRDGLITKLTMYADWGSVVDALTRS